VTIKQDKSGLHEAGKLGLNSDLAIKIFGWNPCWDTTEVIEKTASWYKAFLSKDKPARQLCIDQIEFWERAVNKS
jgi:CDP-glucose 4,6-dehydratase